MKDRLYILRAPFEDAGKSWYCNDCATLEGALLVNPHWNEAIDVCRMDFPRPREDLVALVGEGHQGCPVLVMDAKGAPHHAMQVAAVRHRYRRP